MNIADFSVSYERVNDREAMQGGTARYGLIDSNLTLRDALRSANNEVSLASEHRGAYASDSDPEHARWISYEYWEYETGDSVTISIHFPPRTTPASRRRLVALLTR